MTLHSIEDGPPENYRYLILSVSASYRPSFFGASGRGKPHERFCSLYNSCIYCSLLSYCYHYFPDVFTTIREWSRQMSLGSRSCAESHKSSKESFFPNTTTMRAEGSIILGKKRKKKIVLFNFFFFFLSFVRFSCLTKRVNWEVNNIGLHNSASSHSTFKYALMDLA